MSKPPISCYIRTLNEERRIGDVLDSLQDIAEEIILIDCGSTDRTLEIAEEYGVKVIIQEWLGYGSQKRVGEEASRNDWVLDLDADEIVSPELANEIKELFAKGSPELDGCYFRIVTVPPVGKIWRKCCEVQRVKLYNRTKLQIPDHAAWDQFKIGESHCVKTLQGALLHHSFQDIEHLTGKLNRESSVRAREKKLKPLWQLRWRILFGFWFYLFRNVVWRGMWRRGIYSISVAAISAGGRWLTDVKMYEMHRLQEKEK